MTSSGPDETSPPPELQGLDPKDLLQAGLQTIPPATLPPQPVDSDATIPVARPPSTQPAPQQAELPLPEELTAQLPAGNYHVEGFLGQGGMGAVYKGTQVRLKRPVAIKIMRRDQGQDFGFEQRFEREAQAMAKLNHPNIVSVIDYGEAGPDYLYIVMELVDGADLMDVIRGGQMTQEMALTLLPQICDALQFAHDHGIVHRDIKPSNIMVTRNGRVKMADFGLAKPMDAIETGFRTQTGTGMGTPDYAAPEQFDPNGHIDHRADIYALGVMIYQMITGQLPRGAWKRPSERAPVAPQWDEIVSRAMQSDPSDRYQQASEVKTDVTSIPLGAKSDAGTPAPKESAPAGRSARITSDSPHVKSRAPLIFGLVVGAVVILLGAFIFMKEPAPMNNEAQATASTPASALSSSDAQVSRTQVTASSIQWRKAIWTEEDLKKKTIIADGEWACIGEKAGAANGWPIAAGGQKVTFKDGVVRLRYRWQGETILLKTRNEKTFGQVSLWGPHVELGFYLNSADTRPFQKVTFPGPLKVGDEGTLEIAAIGNRIHARLNDSIVLSSPEIPELFPSGFCAIQSVNTSFRDVEYAILDGIPDPLKALGWAVVPETADPSSANKGNPFTNTLGMKFVPVPGTQVLFSIWHTRVQDYAAFAKAQEMAGKKVDSSWKTANKDGVPVGFEPDHPVVVVSWEDAQAFCQWLTTKESAEGKLAPGNRYRLPTDEEWSAAVGLPPEQGTTPEEKNQRGTTALVFPWGKEWPPTKNAGNFADETFHSKFPPNEKTTEQWNKNQEWVAGYTDGFATTSPVGSFLPNTHGLYDMGGNVWQWCEDWWSAEHNDRVLRGGSWGESNRLGLRSSARAHAGPTWHRQGYGFRCVLAPAPATAVVSPAPNLPVSKSSAPTSIKLWDSAEKLPKKPGVSWENGALKISSGSVDQSTPTYRDSIARVSVQLNPDARRPEVWLRKHSATNSGYKIALDVPGRKVAANVATDGVDRRLAQWPLARVYAPNEWLKLEFRVIGDELTVLADGKVLGTLHDSTRSQPGGLMLYAEANGYFKDIEYVPLDAAAAPSPGTQGSKASDPKFPPGRWVKLFTKPEDLPADLRKPDSGVTWEDGWIRFGGRSRTTLDLPANVSGTRNYGVRLHSLRTRQDVGLHGAIVIRDQKSDFKHYSFSFRKAGVLAGEMRAGQQWSPLFNSTRPMVAVGQEYTMEFGAVGDRVIGRYGGMFCGSALNAHYSQGSAYISGADDIRDIEFINLDGLPEAEALRLLGVDQQGKDLRGKTISGSPSRAPQGSPSPGTATKDAPFVNSLGMKFVPVPITGGPTDGKRVLFSIWETRVQDYEAFVKEMKLAWPEAEFPQGPTHPAVKVGWDDARAFCNWLTDKERRAGSINSTQAYRLPSDHEWSCAAGIGELEDPTSSPQDKSNRTGDMRRYSWGSSWPPSPNGGNFGGEETREKKVFGDSQKFIPGYHDDFPYSAPVGTFQPTPSGLYDLNGNVWEWCQEPYDSQNEPQVIRGGGFDIADRNKEWAFLSFRQGTKPDRRAPNLGFRCVLAPTAGVAQAPAAVFTAPNLPVSKSADPKFPPGQWVKPWTSLADIPDANVSEGWAILAPSNAVAKPPGAQGRNWGIRVWLQGLTSGSFKSPQMQLRYVDHAAYKVRVIDGAIIISRVDGDKLPDVELKRTHVKMPAPGQDYLLEFIAIGQTLHAKLNGEIVSLELPRQ
jgi:serine/threonine protein kinase/formylglycine-generating enzyme required for sulfatase activity